MPLFAKQKEFVKAFKSKKYWYMLFGGAISGGKSIVCIGLIHELCLNYPKTRFAIIRKNLSTLKRTSIPSYEKVLELNRDQDSISFNRSDFISKYQNGSEILFMEADITKDPNLNKLRGVEVTCSLLEEANEMPEQVFSILKTRTGRWKNKQYRIPPIILLNCNPDSGWVKRVFYDPSINGTLDPPFFFLQSLPEDNPHNTPEYMAALKTLPDAEYQRLAKGNWEYSDNPSQLISYLSLKNAFTTLKITDCIKQKGDGRHLRLSVDVARYGDDRSVFCFMFQNKIVGFEVFVKRSTSEIARFVSDRAKQYGIPEKNIVVDVVGLGSGTVDTLRDMNLYVISFNGGEAPTKKPSQFNIYKNLRAQAHWEFREELLDQKIEVPEEKNLIFEATNVNYRIDDRVILIESKEAFKKRCNISPDYFDAAVMVNHLRMRGEYNRFKEEQFLLGETLETLRT